MRIPPTSDQFFFDVQIPWPFRLHGKARANCESSIHRVLVLKERDSCGSPARSNIQVLPSAGSSQSLSPGDAPSACPTIGARICTRGRNLFSKRTLCSLVFPLEYRAT